ncbi:hypothetical protein COCCADRAFT_1335 [Bipolaris zeicola 26-R-13]|uniref:Uncharacterized protein n=1 Tax=Cochliobolus carbonum (strain 26-R-13) TaxID=930089 RepID=W6YJR0_COCC2|nr:uncharacterized protein COCCADRAFT_1335 [Bipolaris zeicola 26-R-13]EUC37893.1 hypothetical protein COCCADRAFT_1335 [Bipolaris zeicola 26-R-13]
MDVEAINKSLLKAVEEGDLPEVQKIILGIPESSNGQNWSFLSLGPVYRACSKGDVQIVEFLLKQCRQEDFTDFTSRTTLLHRAVQGEGTNFCYTVGFLTGFAAGHGGPRTVKKYVNIPDHEGKTALHHVAAMGDYAMLDILFEAGADIIVRDHRGLLAAHIACIEKKYETMIWLFKKDPTGIDEIIHHDLASGSTCLHLVAKRNCGRELGYLLGLVRAPVSMIPDIQGMYVWDLACKGNIQEQPRVSRRRVTSGKYPYIDPELLYDSEGRPKNSETVQRFPINLEAASVLIFQDHSRAWPGYRFDWKALFGKLLIEDRIKIKDMDRFMEGFQYEQYIRDPDNHGPAVLKHREPSCTVTHGGGSKSFTIAMPYFKVLTEDSISKWRKPELVNESLKPFLTDHYSKSLESLKAPYVPLTLDEYCCPALPKSMLDRRNGDQVLTKAENTDSYPKELVTVCQLWILQCTDGLITAHEPERESSTNSSEPDFPSWGHDCLAGDVKRYIGIMLSHFVDSLNRPSETGSGNPILNTFENFIASCAHGVDEYSRGEDVKKFDIDKERKFLHDIDDIRGELEMIKRVILQQEEVWKTFASNAWPEHWTSGPEGHMVVKDDEKRSTQEEDEWQLILRTQSQFDRFRRRIAQLDEDAARMEKSIMAKLDLKQKHASLQESHATAVISAAVLGFTVITIIFTPLSFLTSLFALSIDRFQRNQVDFFIPDRENEADFTNRTRVYTTNYIGKWAATTVLVSNAIALLFMWLVVEYGMGVPVLRHNALRLLGLPKRIWKSKFVSRGIERFKRKKVPEEKDSTATSPPTSSNNWPLLG